MLSVGRVMEYSALTNATAPKSNEEISQKKDTTLAADSTDQYVKSGVSFTPAYTKATVTDNRSNNTGTSTMPDSNAASQVSAQKQAEQSQQEQKVKEQTDIPKFTGSEKQIRNQLMKEMVRDMFKGQFDDSNKTGARRELEEILSSFNEEDEEEPDYWSAEKTADRILDFAKKLAGDDDEAFDTLKNAFEQGFRESEKLLGGKKNLPQVSYDTYDRVQKGFDDWAKEIAERAKSTESAGNISEAATQVTAAN